jgi:hypothetical protein
MQKSTDESVPTKQSNQSNYPEYIPDDLIAYGGSPFYATNSGEAGRDLFEMGFGGTDFNGIGQPGNIHGGYNDPTAEALNQLMNALEDSTQHLNDLEDNWQYENAPQ